MTDKISFAVLGIMAVAFGYYLAITISAKVLEAAV